MIASLMVALMCAFSPSNTNSLYPSYQYCADMGGEYDYLLPSMVASNGHYYYATSHIDFDSKLYFNDSTSWQVQEWDFTVRIRVYDMDDSDSLVYSYNDHYLYTGSYYTNETFDNFRFDFSYYFEDGDFYFMIKNNGIIVYSEQEYSYLVLNDDYYFDLGWSGSYCYGQIQDYVQETLGYYDGYNSGVSAGYNTGYSDGYYDGNAVGHQDGFAEGYQLGSSQDEAAVAIFSGIINIALIPINFFLACLNFEVFGIHIGAFVSALLTVAIVVIITRMVVNGGNGGNNG